MSHQVSAAADANQGPKAVRGGQPISNGDLVAHLASLIRLENVGVFLGAGASVGEPGGRTVGQVWGSFIEGSPEAVEFLRSRGFLGGPASSTPDVEELLDRIEIALMEMERRGESRTQRWLSDARDELRRHLFRAALLDPGWWEDGSDPERLIKRLPHHRALLQKLAGARSPGQPMPWVFTTNYDLALELAAETAGLHVVNGFAGLHHRTFASQHFTLGFQNTLARGQARFGAYGIALAKLHGSLTWYRSPDGLSLRERSMTEAWQDLAPFLDGQSGRSWDGLVLPSAAKYSQTVGFVTGELLRRFNEFLTRPQTALLVSGYSFSDAHLNRILASALLNPTFHLVIYLPEFRSEGQEVKDWIAQIEEACLPQVTLVGGGERAHFSRMVQDLPDPTLIDSRSEEITRSIRTLMTAAKRRGDHDRQLGQ